MSNYKNNNVKIETKSEYHLGTQYTNLKLRFVINVTFYLRIAISGT